MTTFEHGILPLVALDCRRSLHGCFPVNPSDDALIVRGGGSVDPVDPTHVNFKQKLSRAVFVKGTWKVDPLAL